MDNIVNIATVSDYNAHWGIADRHPLVNVLEGSQVKNPIPNCLKNFGMYVVFLKDVICADYLKYGRQEYDFQENTLVFVSPGQVLGHPADGSTYQAKGWCLYFSPELLHGTQLGRHMKDYSFFSYDVHEALHLSLQERETIIDCLKKIDDEINNGADKHSNTIIASAIELFLNYCNRFYDRQFITRKKANKDILGPFRGVAQRVFRIGETAIVRNAVRSLFCRAVAPVSQLFRRPDKKGNGQVGSGIRAAENHGYGERHAG